VGWFYSDLSLLHAPRSCQNVELSELQVEVVSWLCSAHFVSVKKKKKRFLSQESGYARLSDYNCDTATVTVTNGSESSSWMLHQIMTDLSTSKLETV